MRAKFGRQLRFAAEHAERKTAGMCAEILKPEEALWTFVDVEGVEPTTNTAEWQIRPTVLQRKGSFGCGSAAGSRFIARILTAVAAVRQQGGCVQRSLAEALAAYRATRSAPPLIAISADG